MEREREPPAVRELDRSPKNPVPGGGRSDSYVGFPLTIPAGGQTNLKAITDAGVDSSETRSQVWDPLMEETRKGHWMEKMSRFQAEGEGRMVVDESLERRVGIGFFKWWDFQRY